MLGNTIGTQRKWCKLVLVCAPAGYGKSTLLADFFNSNALTSCWLHLDSDENEPLRFLALVLASITQQFPHIDASLATYIANSSPYATSPDTLIQRCHTFIDMLSEQLRTTVTGPLALILCNYETVNENALLTEVVEYLLETLPQQCVLVVESRAIPRFNFSLLIAKQQVFGLGTQHLRFTPQQIVELATMLAHGSISIQQAEEMAAAYDGWITGILLGTHMSMLPAFPFHIDQPSTLFEASEVESQQQDLFHYLVSEIFKEHEDRYRFLRDLAILPEMPIDWCNALLASTDAEQRLQELEREGLFVMHYKKDEQTIYTFHPILRELLMHDLQTQEPARWRQLHQRACQLCIASQQIEEAIIHALAAQDYMVATDVMAENARSLLHQGHSDRLAGWIDTLPPSFLEQSVPLLSVRATIHIMKYEFQPAASLTEKALDIFAQNSNGSALDDEALHAELLITKASILFRSGEYVLAQQLCRQALHLLPADESQQRTQAYQILGACDCMLGHCQNGIIHLQQALHLQKRTVVSRQTALLHMYLANAYNITGNFALAEHHRSRAQQNFEELNDTQGKIDSLIGMGTTKHLRGLLPEAETIFQQALHLAQHIHSLSSQAYALLNLSEVAQDRHDYQQALTLAEDGQQYAEQVHDSYLTNCLLGNLALSYIYLQDSASALLYAEKMTVNDAEQSGFEYALHRFIKGIILFEQRYYQQAKHVLSDLDTNLGNTELQQIHIRTLIYLAACNLAINDTQGMQTAIARAMTLVRGQNAEHLARVEASRLPALARTLQNMPEAAFIWQENEEDKTAENEGVLETHEDEREQPEGEKQRAQARIAIFAFGEPAVLIDDIPITHWRVARAMELFFFLLNAEHPVHKEQIITAFWPEGDDHAEQNMRTTIYHLRRTIGEQCVLYRAGTYTLQLDARYQDAVSYDVAQFRAYAEQAQHLIDYDEKAARTCYQQMVSLYKGDYVQSFYLDWSLQPRRELRDQYLHAHQQLAFIAWNMGEYEESAEHWRQMLALDDCQETAHEGLMRCYMKLGKRDLALRQYRQCARDLHSELGVAPGPALQKLYQRLTQ
jgi:LuxR family maltose regulon positive regulatory protein